jgi:hypothetical protein
MRTVYVVLIIILALALCSCDEESPGPEGSASPWSIAYHIESYLQPTADFWFTTPDDGWAVVGSKVLRYDGAHWREVKDFGASGNEGDYCEAVCALAPDDVWVGGDFADTGSDNYVYHYDGAAWKQVPLPVQTTWGIRVHDLYFVAPTAGWAATSAGIFSYNGNSWTRQTEDDAGSLAMLSANDGWANAAVVGQEHDELYRWNGSTWTQQDVYKLFNDRNVAIINNVVFTAPNDGWVTGVAGPYFRGRLAHFDGHTWTRVALPGDVPELNAAAFPAGADGIVTSSAEEIGAKVWWKRNGTFTSSPLPANNWSVRACAAPASDRVWLAAFPNEYSDLPHKGCYILYYRPDAGK